MMLGIGGGVAAALVVLLVTLLIFRPKGDPASATPTPGATTVAATSAATTAPTASVNASATPTSAATAAPTATSGGAIVDLATATRPATTPASATAGATSAGTTPTRPPTTPTTTAQTTWTDPDGFVSLKFPSGWRQGKDASSPTNLLELEGPDSYMALNVEDPQQGTLPEEIDIIKRNQGNSQKYTYTDQQVQDITVGGEPAKRMTFTYTDKTDASKVNSGVWWVVNHEGRQYGVVSGPVGTSRQAADAVVSSLAFPAARLSTWVDNDKTVRLRHPKEWTASRDATSNTNALKLSGVNDEIVIFVDILAPGTTTVDQAFKSIRDGGSDDSKTTRTYDPVVDTKVAGQPAKSMAYKYQSKANPNLQAGIATIWIVDYKGKRYEFFCSNMASHRPEIEAVIATVLFLK